MQSGNTVYWITGLSHSGKTTLGRLLVDKLRKAGRSVVFLDGDELREVYGDAGYSSSSRRDTALRHARLCRLLFAQGFDVVCCTISLFHDVQEWNRANISGYREIFLKAPVEVLRGRDRRGVYASSEPVSGVDIAAEEPRQPDLVLDASGIFTPEELLARVL